MANERVLRPASERADRPRRTPISGKRNILTVRGKEPGFEYRIAKDSPGRIDELMEAGYEIVTHSAEVGDKRVGTPTSEGSPVKVSLGRGETGYLMRQKKEWYDEDQAAKEAEIKAREESMIDQATRENYGKFEIHKGSQNR